jgi:hypothetical protein
VPVSLDVGKGAGSYFLSGGRKYDITKEGDLDLAGNKNTILSHIKGARDERSIHEGMPAADENLIVS